MYACQNELVGSPGSENICWLNARVMAPKPCSKKGRHQTLAVTPMWCNLYQSLHHKFTGESEFRKLVKISWNYWHKLVVFVFLEHSDLVHLDHAKDASVLVHCVF